MRILIFCLFVLLGLAAHSQLNEKTIGAIDSKYQKINGGLLRCNEQDVICSAVAERIIYDCEKAFRLVKVRIIENETDKKVAWLYEQGELIYSESSWQNIRNDSLLDRQKFYLQHNRLFAWFENGGTAVDSSSARFKETRRSLAAFVAKQSQQ